MTSPSNPKNRPGVARFVFPVSPWSGFKVDTLYNAYGAGYAFRKDKAGRYQHHTGIDINGKGGGNTDEGLPAYATHDGVVEFVHFFFGQGFGWCVGIRHVNSGLKLYGERFGHLKEEPLVQVGQSVAAGTQIGRIGRTGDPTGKMNAHLHFDYFRTDPKTLPGGWGNWPGSDGNAVLANYADALSVWKSFGAINREEV